MNTKMSFNSLKLECDINFQWNILCKNLQTNCNGANGV